MSSQVQVLSPSSSFRYQSYPTLHYTINTRKKRKLEFTFNFY